MRCKVQTNRGFLLERESFLLRPKERSFFVIARIHTHTILLHLPPHFLPPISASCCSGACSCCSRWQSQQCGAVQFSHIPLYSIYMEKLVVTESSPPSPVPHYFSIFLFLLQYFSGRFSCLVHFCLRCRIIPHPLSSILSQCWMESHVSTYWYQGTILGRDVRPSYRPRALLFTNAASEAFSVHSGVCCVGTLCTFCLSTQNLFVRMWDYS